MTLLKEGGIFLQSCDAFRGVGIRGDRPRWIVGVACVYPLIRLFSLSKA